MQNSIERLTNLKFYKQIARAPHGINTKYALCFLTLRPMIFWTGKLLWYLYIFGYSYWWSLQGNTPKSPLESKCEDISISLDQN